MTPKQISSKRREALRVRLTLDRGLASWIRAYHEAYGLHATIQETIIYLVRSAIIERSRNEASRKLLMPHLPADIQRAWGRR